MSKHTHLGKSHKLVDGEAKVLGQARYAGDVLLPGMLHAKVILSPYAHANILGVDARAALALPGVVAVLTHDDLVTRHRVATSRESAVLAKDRVLFAGQPVALVVATNPQSASDAANLVDVNYEALPVACDLHEAMQDQALVWPNGLPKEGEGLGSAHGAESGGNSQSNAQSNVRETKRWARGDTAQAFANADVIVEHHYRNAWVHQAYLEPHACVAEPHGTNRLTLYTSTQGQFVVRNEVARLVGLPQSNVRVVPMTVGGAFGAKYGTLEPLCAAAALAVRAPVKLVFTRSEDLQATTPSPATEIWLRTACTKDGRITALEARATVDNGAFPFLLGGALPGLLGGYYKCDNISIEMTQVLTHKAPGGAYRAPLAPNATFALESNIDEMARRVGMDALAFRLQNCVEEGDLSGSGRAWPHIGLKTCLETLANHPVLKRNNTSNPRFKEGLGIALGGWGGAFSPAGAVLRVDASGTVQLQLGSVDISGVHGTLQLVAAETLGVSPDTIAIVQGDTDSGPYAPNSGGSQVTVSVAGAVQDAATQARTQLLALAATQLEASIEDLTIENGVAQVRGVPSRGITVAQLAAKAERTPGGPGPIVAQGRAAMKAGAPGFAVHAVRVRVDTHTGHVTPLEYVSVQDVGFAMNPTLIEGQMHGGAVQGLGMALYEALHFDESGNNTTSNFLGYALPRASDVPAMQTVIVEDPSQHGPYGARVVGEPPIIEAGGAIANAICNAVGVRVTALPIKPETLWTQLQTQNT